MEHKGALLCEKVSRGAETKYLKSRRWLGVFWRQRVRSLLLRSPGDVVGPRGRAVLVHQLLHHLARVVQLVKVVLEDVLLAELLQEGLALSQLVVLPARPLEQLRGGKINSTGWKNS